MIDRYRHLAALSLLLSCLGLTRDADAQSPAPAIRYSVINLGAGEPANVSLNSNGQVAFTAYKPYQAQYIAFFWTPGRAMAALGTLGGPESTSAALNDAAQVLGSSPTPTGRRHAFVWSARMRDIGPLGGIDAAALDISAAGQVVDGSTIANGTRHAFSWRCGAGMADLNRQLELAAHVSRTVVTCDPPNGVPCQTASSGG